MQDQIVEMLQQIPDLTPMKSLYADDPDTGTYCCLTCRSDVKRVYIPLIHKYALPVCKCVVKKHEEEIESAERLKRKNEMERAYRGNIMNEDLKRASFDGFERREGTQLVFNEARSFANEFQTRKQGLFFYGKPGNGKSHLMAAIHHELDRQGYICLFVDWSKLSILAKDTFNKNSKVTLNDIINTAIQCDLLTLDEIGSGTLSEFEFTDILFPIINGRQGKKTNYTTNLDLKRLRKWFAYDAKGNELDVDGRLIDRIIGSCDIRENLGTSKRQEDALKRLGG